VEQNIQEYINQTTLNPILFDGLEIKPEVREVLLKIANYFWDSMELDIDYQDALLLGSSANYNWTEDSDIDLHITIDFSQFDDPELIKKYFNSVKSKFNESHDLKIGDNEVELYIQDSNEPNSSIGIFSILNNKWIQDPVYEKVEIPDLDITQEADTFKQQIDQLIQLPPSKDTLDQISEFTEDLKQYRQSGLDKDGEYSIENLAFKELRNSGYIERIMNRKNEVIDRILVDKTPLDEIKFSIPFEESTTPIDFLSKTKRKKDPFGLNAYAVELAKGLEESYSHTSQTPEQVMDFKTLLLSLTDHLRNKLNVTPLPKVKFIDNDIENAKDILGTTAYYDPNLKSITLYTFNRHPKDVLRSYSHEMVHHMQNLENRLINISTTNINEDDYLKELEREAYEKGNMLFREWENALENN
jgi:predicted nucleotidyltransferase